MEAGIRQVLLYILAGVIALGAISFTISVFSKGLSYNRVLVEETHEKASSRYELPNYYNPTLKITKTEAYTDIIGTSPSVGIQINGTSLDDSMLSKARGGDPVAVNALKTELNRTNYHKVSTYDGTGELISINFIGE